MYYWRKLTDEQRRHTLAQRKLHCRPWHSPPHTSQARGLYLITATCYEHKAWIGTSEKRMDGFAADLLTALQAHTSRIDAWVILPNHYHAVILTDAFPALLHELGLLHGRSSFCWNQEDSARTQGLVQPVGARHHRRCPPREVDSLRPS